MTLVLVALGGGARSETRLALLVFPMALGLAHTGRTIAANTAFIETLAVLMIVGAMAGAFKRRTAEVEAQGDAVRALRETVRGLRPPRSSIAASSWRCASSSTTPRDGATSTHRHAGASGGGRLVRASLGARRGDDRARRGAVARRGPRARRLGAAS